MVFLHVELGATPLESVSGPIFERQDSFLESEPNFRFVVRHSLAVYGAGGGGAEYLDGFLTCQKFWSANSGFLTVEGEPRADSPTTVSLFWRHCGDARR